MSTDMVLGQLSRGHRIIIPTARLHPKGSLPLSPGLPVASTSRKTLEYLVCCMAVFLPERVFRCSDNT